MEGERAEKDRAERTQAPRRANEQSSKKMEDGKRADVWAVIKGQRLRGPAAV